MRRASFDQMHCSVAQTLEVVGEWWTLLIVRDLFFGVRRFDEFQERLGIARNVLASRLQTLVDAGVVEKVPYQERPLRHEYRLTPKGRDLSTVVTALREWGDRWAAPAGAPIEGTHHDCGGAPYLQPVCDRCGEIVARADLEVSPGPGAGPHPVWSSRHHGVSHDTSLSPDAAFRQVTDG